MYRTSLSIPEIAIIAGTRAALGAGVALLLADHLNQDQRRAVGWTLTGVGAISTLPIVVQLLSDRHSSPNHHSEISPRPSRRAEYVA